MKNTIRLTEKDRQLATKIATSCQRLFTENLLDKTKVDALHTLPPVAGVYFATAQGKVLYIGMAKNLLQRCQLDTHHKLGWAVAEGFDALLTQAVPSNLIFAVEQRLIDMFNPPLNGQCSRWWLKESSKLCQSADGRRQTTRRASGAPRMQIPGLGEFYSNKLAVAAFIKDLSVVAEAKTIICDALDAGDQETQHILKHMAAKRGISVEALTQDILLDRAQHLSQDEYAAIVDSAELRDDDEAAQD